MSQLVPELGAFHLSILLSHNSRCFRKLRATSCLVELGIQLFFFLIGIKDLRKIIVSAIIFQEADPAPEKKTTDHVILFNNSFSGRIVPNRQATHLI